jgi:hypothetical protein
MKFDELIVLFRSHGLIIIGVGIILSPIIWGVFTLIHKEHINTLLERIEFCEDKLSYAEKKLKSPAEFTNSDVAAATPLSTIKSDEAITKVSKESYRYPPIHNSNKLTKSEVHNLVKFYGLFTVWKVNPHLRFLEGDVSYWYEQGLSEMALKRQLETRRIILERAETSGKKYPTQGDLSYAAEQNISTLNY